MYSHYFSPAGHFQNPPGGCTARVRPTEQRRSDRKSSVSPLHFPALPPGGGVVEQHPDCVFVCLQVLRRMAVGNGNAKAGGSLRLQRVVTATAASLSPTRKGAGLTQLVVHPVLRQRTMVLMYVW